MAENAQPNAQKGDYEVVPISLPPSDRIDQAAHQTQDSPESNTGNRVIGGILLVIMFGIFWIYGWGSESTLVTTSTAPESLGTQTIYGNLFILSAVFTVIGFGLLFIYFKNSTASALFTSIFIVSFTILISPIFQKFWFNIFITNFHGATPNDSNPDRFYIFSLQGLNIPVDLYGLKIALANAIAQLVMILGLFGRMTPPQVVISSFLFNFAWNLNHFLCILLQQINSENRIFDDYQISNVYLFAASFGIAVSLLIKKPQNFRIFGHNNFSAILSQIGTFFLFLSFCTTTTFYSLKFVNVSGEFSRSYVWQEAFLGTFFALSASVIATYIFAILLGGGKIGMRESILGTIMGAVIYGPVAGTCMNIGAAIATGIAAGFLSALFFHKVYAKINENGIRDSYGIVLIFVISFLGTFLISPTVIKTYYNYNVNLTTFETSQSDLTGGAVNINAARWVLVYVGISIGIGLSTGAVVGIILMIVDKVTGNEYQDKMVFDKEYGLRNVEVVSTERDKLAVTATNLIQ